MKPTDAEMIAWIDTRAQPEAAPAIPENERKQFEQHLFEEDNAPLSDIEKVAIDCFIDFYNAKTSTVSRTPAANTGELILAENSTAETQEATPRVEAAPASEAVHE